MVYLAEVKNMFVMGCAGRLILLRFCWRDAMLVNVDRLRRTQRISDYSATEPMLLFWNIES